MADQEICLGGYVLTLYRDSMLVQARPLSAYETLMRTENDNPPAWIFNSRRTIWLAESGGSSIRERAIEGERIRHAILQSECMTPTREHVRRSA